MHYIKKLSVALIVLLGSFILIGTMTVLAEENVSSNEILETQSSMPLVSYQTHIENLGWEVEDVGQGWKQDGEMSGTSGRGLRLEGIKIKIENDANLGIQYQTHIQNIGWEADVGNGWKENGEMSGTKGLGYRLEAIQMRLTGENAANYDLYYQVHAQNMGWLGWAKNGESAGTAGYGYRLEGIRIAVMKKGEVPLYGSIDKDNPFYENELGPYLSIINQYKEALNRNFKDSTGLSSVNPDIFKRTSYYKNFYYALDDINGDNKDELVIVSDYDGYNVVDLYGIVDGDVKRMFDIENMSFFSFFKICGDQIIKYSVYSSNTTSAYYFYKLEGDQKILFRQIDWVDGIYYLTEGSSRKMISNDAAKKIIFDTYFPKYGIVWNSI